MGRALSVRQTIGGQGLTVGFEPEGMVADTTVGLNGSGNGTPIWVTVLFKYGIVGFLCLGFAYLLASRVPAQIETMEGDLRWHIMQSQLSTQRETLYLHSICVSMAVQSGTAVDACPAPDQGFQLPYATQGLPPR